MIANYHTHTTRCNHATGDEKAYVEQAIEKGLKILGFSDHTPYVFPGTDYYSHFRMKMHELESYVNTVLALKEEYRNDIEIHLGLEAEYYPKLFPLLLQELKNYPIEYMILGQHFLENETDGPYAGADTQDPERIHLFYNQITEALETGCFSYFCHPDLFRFSGDEEIYNTYIRKICQTANRLSIPMELNLLGIREGRHYPTQKLWKIIGEEGCEVVFGSDAHAPDVVYDAPSLLVAEEWAKLYNLRVRETIEFKNPLALLNK